MFNKLKQFKDLRDQAKKMQSALSEVSTVGEAAWGKIKVAINGNQEVQSVTIDPEMLADHKKLEEALRDAFNDAVKKIQREAAMKIKDMGGLDALKDFGM